jgi:hypothetical protein
MMGEEWVIGWIIDGLAKQFGPGKVSGWIALAALLILLAFGILQLAA